MISLNEIIREYFIGLVSDLKNVDDLNKILDLSCGEMHSFIQIGLDEGYFHSFVREEYTLYISDNDLSLLQDDIYIGWSALNDYRLITLYIESENYSYTLPYYKKM